MSDPQQILEKKARVDTRNPLGEAGILQQVLNYLGPGHWLFAALVSKAWHLAYLQVPEHQMFGVGHGSPRTPIVCVPQMTLYSAAVASAARLALACAVGLNLSSKALQVAAGKWGSKAAILEAVDAVQDGTHWSSVVVGSLQSRDVSTVQWLVEELDCPLPDDAFQIAAFGSCTDTLAWLKQRGLAPPADLMHYAAYNGHWHILQYLHNEGVEWISEACATAARFGSLALLKQLREHGCPRDSDEMTVLAAWSGSVPLLKWFKERGIVFTETTMSCAVCRGHIAAVEYLHFTEHWPWSTTTCMLAALHDQLDLLNWLQQHGCPCIDAAVKEAAASGGSISVMTYMLEQQQQQVEVDVATHTASLTQMLAAAGANGKLAAAQWLRAQGAGWPDVLQFTALEQQQWQGDVLEWARDQGCTSPVE
jgi:hypothetical protein